MDTLDERKVLHEHKQDFQVRVTCQVCDCPLEVEDNRLPGECDFAIKVKPCFHCHGESVSKRIRIIFSREMNKLKTMIDQWEMIE